MTCFCSAVFMMIPAMKKSFYRYAYRSNSPVLAEKSGKKVEGDNFEFQWHLKGFTESYEQNERTTQCQASNIVVCTCLTFFRVLHEDHTWKWPYKWLFALCPTRSKQSVVHTYLGLERVSAGSWPSVLNCPPPEPSVHTVDHQYIVHWTPDSSACQTY